MAKKYVTVQAKGLLRRLYIQDIRKVHTKRPEILPSIPAYQHLAASDAKSCELPTGSVSVMAEELH